MNPPEGPSADPPRLRLAIVGDTHYLNPAYHRGALGDAAGAPSNAPDITRHTWTTQEVLPQLVAEVRAAAPDLVVHLGDVVQGHCDAAAGDAAELREAWEFFTALPRPLLFVRGTHEGRPGGPADAIYRDLFLTEVARTSGQVPATVTTNYALVVGGIHDPIFSPDVLRGWVGSMPRARLALLDSNHEIPIEQPRELAAVLEAFIAGLG